MNYPPIVNTDPSFAYYEGIARAVLVLTTGCTEGAAAEAVKTAVHAHKGTYPVTADLACAVILNAAGLL